MTLIASAPRHMIPFRTVFRDSRSCRQAMVEGGSPGLVDEVTPCAGQDEQQAFQALSLGPADVEGVMFEHF